MPQTERQPRKFAGPQGAHDKENSAAYQTPTEEPQGFDDARFTTRRKATRVTCYVSRKFG